jgi:hypothetical protein
MKKIIYSKLNARQQETYNFQKVTAIFADYGYTTIKLSDDWMGADFIALNFNGKEFLRVQLKGRVTFERKYLNKDLFICFQDKLDNNWYLYPHDKMLKKILPIIKNSDSWKVHGSYSFPSMSVNLKKILMSYIIE